MKKNLSAEEIAVALLELGEDATVERIEELQACVSESALWEGADRASAVRVLVERVCDLLEDEPVDGGAAVFTDGQRALEYGRLFQSGEFSDLALRDLPDLEKHRGSRIGVKAFALAHNVKYGTDELLFLVTQPDALDGSTFFARALTALSPRPPVAAEAASQTRYECGALSDDELEMICAAGLEPGEIWRPRVQTEVRDERFFWYDREDHAPTRHGPFSTRRSALLDAIEAQGIQDPSAWGIERLDDRVHRAVSTDPDSRLVPVPAHLLERIVDMAKSYVGDIESGLEEGIYDVAENRDLPEKQRAVEQVEQLHQDAMLGGHAPDAAGVIKLPAFGIVIDIGANGGAAIMSDLHEEDEPPEVKAAMDAVEAMVLAHAAAGIDVRSPAYLEGIDTAVEAIGNHVDGLEVSRGLEM
ncbi:hypothetical protein [Burkholderia vietnamiensis]|uniref:hypothetical protein n=1 Tax=Burkholderia vietnamiensis TaxID=60552 RepID=UPI001592D682|nr:hypothetical protein [Burkholderia vietnamiensis]